MSRNMSRLTVERAHDIINRNRQRLYHLPKRYAFLDSYLKGSLRETLFCVFKFISDKQIIIADHRYNFYIDNKCLTYKVRKKVGGEATSSRHMNLLCALGLFTKQEQNSQIDKILDVNKDFLLNNPDKTMPVNVFSFREYTDRELERLEDRAKRLKDAGITSGNISFNYLMVNGLQDIAREVYPANKALSAEKKIVEFQEMLGVMSFIIEVQGYATREDIINNMSLPDCECEKLFKIFKLDIETFFCYCRPNKKLRSSFGLRNQNYIYTRKENSL